MRPQLQTWSASASSTRPCGCRGLCWRRCRCQRRLRAATAAAHPRPVWVPRVAPVLLGFEQTERIRCGAVLELKHMSRCLLLSVQMSKDQALASLQRLGAGQQQQAQQQAQLRELPSSSGQQVRLSACPGCVVMLQWGHSGVLLSLLCAAFCCLPARTLNTPLCLPQSTDSGAATSGSPTAGASGGGPGAASCSGDPCGDAAAIGERFRALSFGERVSLCTSIFKDTEPARAALRPVGRYYDSFSLEPE